MIVRSVQGRLAYPVPVELDPATDYPLGTRRPDLVRTPSGIALDRVTLPAARAGELASADVRATPETLALQAEVARKAGRPQLADGLERASELASVPDGELLEIYTALRPGRSTRDELEAWPCASTSSARDGRRRSSARRQRSTSSGGSSPGDRRGPQPALHRAGGDAPPSRDAGRAVVRARPGGVRRPGRPRAGARRPGRCRDAARRPRCGVLRRHRPVPRGPGSTSTSLERPWRSRTSGSPACSSTST